MGELWLEALALVMKPDILLWTSVGTIIGIICGALPGVTATMGLTVMLPVTYYLAPVPSMALLLSIWAGAISGASIPAILLKIPGNPNAIATMNDGYPMARKGMAGKALGAAASASFFGGIASLGVLVLVAPALARVALSFGPAEYFALGVFGMTIISSLSGKSLSKGLVSATLGIMVSLVGLDQISGASRLTFGRVELLGGIPLIPVLIGLFAVSQVLRDSPMARTRQPSYSTGVRAALPGLTELLGNWRVLILGAAIGTIIGIIPGTGASIAVVLAYEWARRTSKRQSEYGTGILEGVLAPEAANNAVQSGALIPLLSLGVPGDSSAAVLLGALIIQGYTPGPRFFAEAGSFAYAIFIVLALANIAMLLYQLVLIRVFTRVLDVPSYILSPAIMVLSFIGAYALRNNLFDVWVALAFGVVGYYFDMFGYPVAPFVLGIILGPLAEIEFRRALAVSGGSPLIFVTRPISLALLLVAVLSVAGNMVAGKRKSREVA